MISTRALRFVTALSVLLSTATAAVSFAADSTRVADSVASARIAKADSTADSAHFIVRIERREILNRRILDTLDITVQSYHAEPAGFDFKLGCNDPSVDIKEILPGKIFDSCKWDYFSARRLPSTGKPGLPLVLWHIVGLARAMPGSSQPLCFGSEKETPLMRLVVSNEHVLQMKETQAAIFFVWEKCTDNVVSGLSGTKLSISASVQDYIPVDLVSSEELFPTRRGTPAQCINLNRPNYPLRQIEFVNGGVSFKYDLTPQNPQAPTNTPPLSSPNAVPDSAAPSHR
jgi:hypothetical protein